MERRIDSLAKEPAIAERVHGQHGLALMQAAGDSALYFVDDDALREMSLLFSESAARATPETCAQLYLGGADAFPNAFAAVMQFADSALVDRWASFMVRVVRAGLLRPPLGRLASTTELTTVLRRMVLEQPAGDRPRLRRGAAKTGDARDACFYTVTMYRQLGSLPASEGGPVLRAMMLGVKPKLGS